MKVEDAVNADNEYYTKVSYYCLENVHKIGEYKEKNTTVVQVEAVMYPKEFQNFTLAHDATENKYSVTIAKGEEKTAQTVGTSFYLIRAVSDNDTEGKLVNNYVLKSNLLAQFEKLSEADKTGITEKDAKVTKVISVLNGLNYAFSEEYEDGKGYFNVWVNNLINATPTSYDASPVFRNDWYNLAIQKVTLPGSPNGDLEDDKPINPETAIQVKVTVKPWNLINHNVDLQ